MDTRKDRRMDCLRMAQAFEVLGSTAKVNARASAYHEFLKNRAFSRNAWDALTLAHETLFHYDRSVPGGRMSSPATVLERALGYLEFVERPFEDPVLDDQEVGTEQDVAHPSPASAESSSEAEHPPGETVADPSRPRTTSKVPRTR
jgi:hypothetical protein